MTTTEPRRLITPPGPPTAALVAPAPRPRFEGGWRAGKPAEDPEKLKRWGRISARPSEYLIHMRRGKVLAGSSGQGASCFKLPGDAVAVVPTTVQQLRFTAEQVTHEKVGVGVTGVAVYRIAEPLIAFRMVNFSYPERAQEKLEELLGEMFVGAVRRLVANLTVEECLCRRKEGIAAELMREIVPVVSGHGKPDDVADAGWGIVMDTVEIQDVRVLSEAVFGNLQARYRKEQERAAREAALTTERAIKLGEAEAERSVELTRLAAETEVQKRRREAEEETRLGEIAAAVRVSEARAAHERRAAARKAEAEIAQVQLEADAEAARHAARMARAQQEIDEARLRAEVTEALRTIAAAELALAELEARKAAIAQDLELTRARALRELENTVSAEIIQLTVAQKLPELAAAFQQRMGEVHVTAVDGANPFGFVAAAVEGVLGMARAAGLSLPAPSALRAPSTAARPPTA
jgi:flotillin